jgi:hypothetical protein
MFSAVKTASAFPAAISTGEYTAGAAAVDALTTEIARD